MVACRRTAFLAVTLVASVSPADVVQVPEGGKAIEVVAKGVVCGPLPGGWLVDTADRRMVTPPPATPPTTVRTLDVKTADTVAGCAASKQTITLNATGAWPELDAGGVTLFPDDGRLELKGGHLKGMVIAWSVAGDDKTPARHGADQCLDATSAKVGTCAVP